VLNLRNLEEGVYTLQVDVAIENLKGRDWWKEWNLGERESFDGSKTYNLLPFLDNLRRINQQMTKSQTGAIARLCYVINKEY